MFVYVFDRKLIKELRELKWREIHTTVKLHEGFDVATFLVEDISFFDDVDWFAVSHS